ncbi:MAG: PilZ domain-containing protein [Phycisphaerales bacterium]
MPNKSTNKIQDSHQNDNTLRLGVRELDALLDKIEQIRPSMDNPDRNFVRWNLRIVRVDLTIEHQTGSKVVLPVATRNISRGGIAVLHSSFVYPNSRCHIGAVLEGGHKLDIKGTVKRCDHIGGKVHELGIKFDTEISTKDILGLDPMQEAYSLERIDPKSLQGNILIINESEFDQQIMLKLLEETELSIAVAENSETAIKRAQKRGANSSSSISKSDQKPHRISSSNSALRGSTLPSSSCHRIHQLQSAMNSAWLAPQD